MGKQIWTYISLTIVASSSWLVADWITPKPEVKPTQVLHRLDSFSEYFTKTVMNPDGTPKHKLSADSMLHYNDDKSTKLEKPQLIFFVDDEPPWTIRSDTGYATSDGKTIFLGGNVFISRPEAPSVYPVDIVTKNLTINPKINYAETDEFAELISNSYQISGIGLNVYFGLTKKVTLLSNVRGKYANP